MIRYHKQFFSALKDHNLFIILYSTQIEYLLFSRKCKMSFRSKHKQKVSEYEYLPYITLIKLLEFIYAILYYLFEWQPELRIKIKLRLNSFHTTLFIRYPFYMIVILFLVVF